MKELLEKADKPNLSEGLIAAQIQPDPNTESFGPTPITKRDILEEAIGVTAERNVSYDAPEDNFARIAAHWNVYLTNIGVEPKRALSPMDVSCMMMLMKIARLEFNPTHHDSIVDVAGYAGCAGQIAAQMRNKS